ncbi:FeoB-associated Cys-rich membrane protein [Plebeiibacterium marinum]|uniref:FeoB-associated Cys-rich membrane protein n=1 Tax=Plebeiibacterium marinum TaxID=2992111 RepID=A0AAE3MFH1_9BACT|nr:FeoB-associated Cys-rich membrane protein [Plebeiobacterium marinum]MCW3806601.1 FeoB-associated Cys-rich membrane protein [Plebeiobacterium marinum]
MVQEILMWCSVSGAFGYAFYSLGKIIYNSFQEKKAICSHGCAMCNAKTELLNNINFKSMKLPKTIA